MMIDAKPMNSAGLGWLMGQSSAGPYLEHPGGGPGFATFLRLYPEKTLGIAVLSNGTDLDGSGLANLLASLDW